jgi:hypothetical protein
MFREGVRRGRTLAGARLDGSRRSGAIKSLEVGLQEKDGAWAGRRRVKVGIIFGIVQTAGVIRTCFGINHGEGRGEVGVNTVQALLLLVPAGNDSGATVLLYILYDHTHCDFSLEQHFHCKYMFSIFKVKF